MNPRVVVVIGPKGIKLTRLVASNDTEEEMCLSLYLKIRDMLSSINKILAGNPVEKGLEVAGETGRPCR